MAKPKMAKPKMAKNGGLEAMFQAVERLCALVPNGALLAVSDPAGLINAGCDEIERYRRRLTTNALVEIVSKCHRTAVDHGWWDEPREDGTCIALMHSELSEALEWLRNGNGPSDHIPPHSGLAEELADVIIRIADYCGKRQIDLGGALAAKMAYNETRPYRHGGKKL
jgi:NTP pyrophosphatase (non-canonical NTP hydrolase)